MVIDFFSKDILYELADIDNIDNNILTMYKSEIEQFGEKRQSEFLKSREIANNLFKRIRVDNFKLINNEKRAPIWPEGIVGSISHSHGKVIVAISKDYKSIGLDLEGIMTDERANKLKDQFLSQEEIAINKMDFNLFATLVFSGKESLFKLIYPLCEEYFGFHVAKMRHVNEKDFQIELKSQSGKVSQFNGIYHGKWQVIGDLVLTSLILNKTD